jgi:hypothetical protein
MQRQVDSVTQTVSKVLAAGARSQAEFRAYFYDEPRLRGQVRGREHVLYRARRDILPPRLGAGHDGVTTEWRIDQVHYPAAGLPSGELSRSTGHWNPGDQWEIFQVDQGEVVLVVRLPGPGRRTELIRCAPGTVLTVAPGSWHLTYVWRGPAVVTNAYSVSRSHNGHAAKYFTRPTLRCGLRLEGTEVVVFRDEADPTQDSGAPVWRVATLADGRGPGLPPLATLFAADGAAWLEDHCAGLAHQA